MLLMADRWIIVLRLAPLPLVVTGSVLVVLAWRLLSWRLRLSNVCLVRTRSVRRDCLCRGLRSRALSQR